MIVAPWQSFVPKEVNFFMTTLCHKLEAECFVPALLRVSELEKNALILKQETCWEAVNGDLSTLGKLKAQVTELLNADNQMNFKIFMAIALCAYSRSYSNLLKLCLESISNAMFLIKPKREVLLSAG